MLTLTLVRHAATALNEQHRYQGWIDPPLSESGRTQALRLGERLHKEEFDRVLCSDLLRCTETAALALPGAQVQPDGRLQEIDFGSWDGHTYSECCALDPARYQAWLDDPTREVPPGGEAFAPFCMRVDAVVDALPRTGRVLLIVHGGPIRRIVARSLGLEWRQVVLMQLSACGITRLALHPEGGHLLCWNDSAHLSLCVKQ